MIIKKIISYYIEKLRTPVIFWINGKKYRFDIFRSAYLNYELEDLKKAYMDLYFIKFSFSESLKNHLYNHMFMHNEFFQKKLCLFKFFMDLKVSKIDKIKTTFLNDDDRLIFLSFGINIKKVVNRRLDSNFLLLIRRFIDEYKISKSTRKFYKEEYSTCIPEKKYQNMISSWAIDEVDSVLEETGISMDNTVIYLKTPKMEFVLQDKRPRLLSFIELMRNKNGYEHFEYVPKINFIHLLKNTFLLYFSSFPKQIKRDVLGVLIQREYYKGFVGYIKRNFPDITHYYSNSVFHSFNTYLTELLQVNGIRTINISWILDTGCPILKYDEFYVCSKTQQACYDAKNTEFKIKHRKRSINTNIPKKPLAIFFVHQCLFTEEVLMHSLTIKPYYKKVLEYIERLAIETEIPIYAKYHPSSKKEDMILSDNIQIIKDVDDLPSKYNYISLTYFSSYVVTLLNKMPFFLINPEKKINLRYIYPDYEEMYITSYEDLRMRVMLSVSHSWYRHYWNNLITVMNKLGF